MSLHLATSSLDRLASWFQSVTGRRLLAEQSPLVGECARRFHGDTLLWAGCHTDLTDTVRGCMIRHRFHLETCAGPEAIADESELGRFRADLHELPLPKNSLDAVVLHHVLESAQDPRKAIREVARVLAPGGRLLIVAFNPWSLWGVRGAYARLFKDSFSGLRFVSSRRLLDWLTVLGFELQHEVKYIAYSLPFSTRQMIAVPPAEQPAEATGVWRKLKSLCAKHSVPFGGVYVISAVKQVSAIRPDWVPSRVQSSKLAPAAYPKLSARVAQLSDRSARKGQLSGNPGVQDPG